MTATEIIKGDRLLRFATIVCVISMGGFLLWSGLAPMAEGVSAFGQVEVDNNRKVIQHLEGGIINEIMVREGDVVVAGQPLLVLTDVAAFAGRDSVAKDLVNSLSSIARLETLLKRESTIDFSAAQLVSIDELELEKTLARQRGLFQQQRETITADIGVLNSRKNGFLDNATNKQVQIDNLERALELLRKELALKRGYLAEQLIQADQVLHLEREEARMQGDLARLSTDQLSDRSQAVEIDRQMVQVRARFNEKLTTELLEARARVSEFQERFTAAQDVVNRTIINAPQAGTVLNLQFSTTGGVVLPGEAILEIVPSESDLVAIVQVSPSDRDSVYTGLSVNTRFSGLHSWQMPSMKGVVSNVSADLKTSPNGEFSYYEARVTIDANALADINIEVIPGMPIEAFIDSGTTRTLLDYLFEPLSAIMRRGARS